MDEALRLMQMSKFSLYSEDRQKSGLDAISDIYSILRDEAARMNRLELSYSQALNWISRKVSLWVIYADQAGSTTLVGSLIYTWI